MDCLMLLTDLSDQVFEACLNCLYHNVSSTGRTTDLMGVSIGGFVPVVLIDFDHMFQCIAECSLLSRADVPESRGPGSSVTKGEMCFLPMDGGTFRRLLATSYHLVAQFVGDQTTFLAWHYAIRGRMFISHPSSYFLLKLKCHGSPINWWA
jgi:hypothetical protein